MRRLPDFSSTALPTVPLGRADRAWLAGGGLLLLAALLAGVRAQQDLLETLISRVLVASRYGTDADVRMTMVKTAKEARAHAKAHERE